MEEIKVGEYVRYDDGTIIKVVEEEQSYYNYLLKNKKGLFNHSPNIIDLIEEGDYVNGCKVYENKKTFLIVYQKVKNSEVDYNYINHNEIKSIVTKEMMKSVEYRVV